MKRLAVVLAILVVWPVARHQTQAARKRLTVDLVTHEGALVARGISRVAWRPPGNQVAYIRPRTGPDAESDKKAESTLFLYDVDTRKERALLRSAAENEKLSLSSYQWSPKGDALLLEGQGDLWLLDVESGQKKRLTHDAQEKEFPTFSPTGERVAFVKKNDIYTLDLKSGAVERVTTDGADHILNGKLDWVYEEELADRSTGRSFEWSPDGQKIAYLRLDDNPVPEYPLTEYLSVHVGLFRQRFPQAGDLNPVPSFHVVNIGGTESRRSIVSLGPPGVEYCGPTFSWTADSQKISFLTLNRAQNELTVHLWDPASESNRDLLVERDSYWINSLEPPHFLGDGGFLWLSERDGWLHLYRYGRDGRLLSQLTRGSWMIDHPPFEDVPTFQVDETGGWVYFVATEGDPRERRLCRVRLDGSGFERLSTLPGTHSLNLSPNGRFLIDRSSAVDQPPEARLLAADGSVLAALDKPENHLGDYALAKTEFVEVKASDGATLYGRLVKPVDFDAARKYPVIVFVYGGPHAQVVQDRWGVTTPLDHLFAQEGYLVWSLDNRGSWGRGHAWESVIFKNMGKRELDDQLAGVQYLKSLPFVDPARLGIWGWSYGGYMTLYALTHAPDVFKCGAAGGPVTDWKFYGSIYTERYMRTPQENPVGYKTSSPLEAASRLRAKVLLIHGADDDNVHMQNTMSFVDALVKAQKPFELYIQPGQKHGFRGDAVRTYLTQRLLDFFQRSL